MNAAVRSGAALVLCLLLAACGGGGGGGGGTATTPLVTATAAAASPTATFSLTIPATTAASVARGLEGVSPGTQSFVVALNSQRRRADDARALRNDVKCAQCLRGASVPVRLMPDGVGGRW